MWRADEKSEREREKREPIAVLSEKREKKEEKIKPTTFGPKRHCLVHTWKCKYARSEYALWCSVSTNNQTPTHTGLNKRQSNSKMLWTTLPRVNLFIENGNYEKQTHVAGLNIFCDWIVCVFGLLCTGVKVEWEELSMYYRKCLVWSMRLIWDGSAANKHETKARRAKDSSRNPVVHQKAP